MCAVVATSGSAGAQEQPSRVLNNQLQLGDVIAGQSLNVVGSDDQITTSTNASGNSVFASTDNEDMDVESDQALEGDVRAETRLEGSGTFEGPVTLATQATGNTAQISAYNGEVNASVGQTIGDVEVSATTEIDAPSGRFLGGASVTTTAIGNVTAMGTSYGRNESTIDQSSAAVTQAVTGVNIQYAPAPINFTSTAIANSTTATGEVAYQDLTVRQSATGERTQASTYISVANGWQLHSGASATANAVGVYNRGGALLVTTDQNNDTYVRAGATAFAYDYGGATVSAFGAGNSAEVGNNDIYLRLDNTQVNSGGVDVIAGFEGAFGYDVAVGATAVGNSVTGYVCADCPAYMDVTNSQTNNGHISATSNVAITGSNRALINATSAVGNSATFYVTRPGQQGSGH